MNRTSFGRQRLRRGDMGSELFRLVSGAAYPLAASPSSSQSPPANDCRSSDVGCQHRMDLRMSGEPTGCLPSTTADLATHNLQARDATAKILLHLLAAPVDEVDHPELVVFGVLARVVAFELMPRGFSSASRYVYRTLRRWSE